MSKSIPWLSYVKPGCRPVLFLTTLTHRRFVDDAIQIVGLPEGARIRLRYRRRYVSEELWRLASDSFEATSYNALIVLGGSSENRNKMAPLRVGEIARLKVAGEIMIADVSLGAYVLDRDISRPAWNDVAPFASRLPTRLRACSASGGIYAQILKSMPASLLVGSDVSSWEGVCKGFFEVDSFSVPPQRNPKVPFLFMIEGLPWGVQRRLRATGSMEVESGTCLRLNIHTFSSPCHAQFTNPVGEVCVDVADSTARLLTSRRCRVDSRRDVKELAVAFQPVFRPSFGHFSFRTVLFSSEQIGEGSQSEGALVSAKGREEIVISRFDVPLKVGLWAPIVAALAASGAAGFATIGEKVINDWNGSSWIPLVTGVLVFLSLYFGFNRNGKS